MASRIDKSGSSSAHFHIGWGGTGELDYFRFDSRDEANESAKLLARPNEMYSIEAFGGACEKCAELLGKAAALGRP